MKCQWCKKEFPGKKGRFCGTCRPPYFRLPAAFPDEILAALNEEYHRSLARHPDSEWAELTPSQMRREIEKELNEFTDASAINDYHGEHGMINEMLHVTMTSFRAYRELIRRNGRKENIK